MANPKSVVARYMKEARNPPLANAASADELMGKAYRELVDLKLGFDSWHEIPADVRPLYDEIITAMYAVGKARKDTHQLRMDVRKYSRRR
jgi:hypothetical protein